MYQFDSPISLPLHVTIMDRYYFEHSMEGNIGH